MKTSNEEVISLIETPEAFREWLKTPEASRLTFMTCDCLRGPIPRFIKKATGREVSIGEHFGIFSLGWKRLDLPNWVLAYCEKISEKDYGFPGEAITAAQALAALVGMGAGGGDE